MALVRTEPVTTDTGPVSSYDRPEDEQADDIPQVTGSPPRRTARLLVALLFVVAVVVAGCGGGEGGAAAEGAGVQTGTVAEATIGQLLRDPDAFANRPVLVRGQAHPVGELGFFLTQEGRSIFVGAPASRLKQLDGGERVAVRAELSQLSDTRAETIHDALDPTAATLQGAPVPVFEEAVGPDKPFLNLRALYGPGEGPPSE